MEVGLDYETRSPVNIKKCSTHRYFEDPETSLLCLSVKVDDYASMPWIPQEFQHLYTGPETLLSNDELWAYVNAATVLRAHNAQFERLAWWYVMVQRYGFPEIPLEKWRCTAAQVAAVSLPRALDNACAALDLEGKDKAGYAIMLKMCKPRIPKKKEREALASQGTHLAPGDKKMLVRPDGSNYFLWNELPEDFTANVKYCLNDTDIEYALSNRVPRLPQIEQDTWVLDQRINDRGLFIDMPSVKAIRAEISVYEAAKTRELAKVTGLPKIKHTEVKQLKEWLLGEGVEMPSLAVATVEAMIPTLPEGTPARRVLELRHTLAKSSVAKYDAMIRSANLDGVVRGTLLFHGASATGRWAGKIVQPQNFYRGTLSLDQVRLCLWAFRNLGKDHVIVDPLEAAASCVRGVIQAPPGYDFLCADFANIEGRSQCWLADETWKLEAFRRYDTILGWDWSEKKQEYLPQRGGPDLYNVAYAQSFNRTVESVTKDERQIGKTSELSMGYAGGIAAYATMADTYGVDLEALPSIVVPTADAREVDSAAWTAGKYFERCEQYGEDADMSLDAAISCDILKRRWRANHPKIVGMWAGMEEAAIAATCNPGTDYSIGRVVFGMRDDFLRMQLPSGRCISMFEPEVAPNGRGKYSLSFMSSVSRKGQGGRWMRKNTYGGDIFQTANQANARDVMRDAMLRVEPRGYETVLTVHDEILAQVLAGCGSQQEFESLMAQLPTWAAGMPIGVDGWRGDIYRKG